MIRGIRPLNKTEIRFFIAILYIPLHSGLIHNISNKMPYTSTYGSAIKALVLVCPFDDFAVSTDYDSYTAQMVRQIAGRFATVNDGNKPPASLKS